MNNTRYDCIIIGAGWAGAIAARDLANNDYKALVLEARDRVGGRAYTMELEGQNIDLGCSWIHGYKEGNPAGYIAAQYDVMAHVLAGTDSEIWNEHGKLSNEQKQSLQEALGGALKNAHDAAATHPPPPESVSLRDHLFGPTSPLRSSDLEKDGLAFSRTLEVPYGAHLEDVALKWHGYAQPFSGSDAGPEGGVQALVAKVLQDAEEHGAQVVLSTKVDRIEQSATGVTIYSGLKSYYSRAVIVTIPLGVLKLSAESLFAPVLPPQRLATIGRTNVGTLEKLALSYSSAWWPNASSTGSFTFLPRPSIDGETKSDDQATQARAALEKCTITVASFAAPTLPYTHPTLLFYLSPTPASLLAEFSDESVATATHVYLCSRFGVPVDQVPRPRASARTHWADDQLSRGATSTPVLAGEGRTPLDFVILGKSLWDGRLGFAGEHTDLDHRGSIAGAVVSGKREAERVSRLLNLMTNDEP